MAHFFIMLFSQKLTLKARSFYAQIKSISRKSRKCIDSKELDLLMNKQDICLSIKYSSFKSFIFKDLQ
jgi:hypothetical protein